MPDPSATVPATDRIGRQDKPLLGIGFKLMSLVAFMVMVSGVKASRALPLGEVIFFRSILALLPILVFQYVRGELTHALSTTRPLAHLARSTLGVIGMATNFLTISLLPLTEATTLTYAVPLVLVALGALILNEQVRLFRWTAVIVGMGGVLIVAWPRLTLFAGGAPFGSAETLGLLAAVAAILSMSLATMANRLLVTTERSTTIVLYFSLVSAGWALLTLPFGWVWPDPWQWAILLTTGIAGGVAQIFLTESYRYGDMSLVAPFEYTSIVLAIVFSIVLFGDWPTAHTLVGGAVIIMASIAIILRERQLMRQRRAALTADL